MQHSLNPDTPVPSSPFSHDQPKNPAAGSTIRHREGAARKTITRFFRGIEAGAIMMFELGP
ncbi:MAG TPA: hypothetical protein VF171_08780 [Trueperaceae bacterium]